VASVVVFALTISGHVDGDSPFVIKLVIRIVGFAVIAAIALFTLWKLKPGDPLPPTIESEQPQWHLAIIPCAIAAAIAFPRLGATPHVEPDEWHHLDVARNLAMHGQYASGNPDEGFILFDDYDSVGPPVILPVAAAMRLAGPRLESARFVMALFFVGFTATVFAFCAPVFGGWAGVFSSTLVIGAWGTAYLGRTLYGEIPAMMFLLLALIAGRAALQGRRVWLYGIAAGLLFGFAVLSKYYLLMAVWPLLGAFMIDRLFTKQIRWPHVAAPAVGALAIIATWSSVQAFADRDVSNAANGQLSMYQHNLLFGIEGFEHTAGYLATQPASFIAIVVGMAFGLLLIHRHIADPTIAALWLFAGFQWYWWLFFNTGNLPRYSWYGWAAIAILLGPVLRTMLDTIRNPTSDTQLTRPLAFACCAAIVLPSVIRTTQETQRIWQTDEMQSTRDLASYIADRPESDRVATAFWPLERSVQFLSGRTVARLRDTDTADQYDVVIVNSDSSAHWIHGRTAINFGPYMALTVWD
jgi:4-amino-4-deoxy-L-arabinose transferase-like glycosyltransferase